MESERETPKPLSGEEIKTGIAQMVADAVYEALSKTCNLNGVSYPKFKTAEPFTIKLLLDQDFGAEFGQFPVIENRVVEIHEEEPGENAVEVDVKVDIPAMPPNQFRRDTNQAVAKTAVVDGKTIERKVKYAPKVKGKAK